MGAGIDALRDAGIPLVRHYRTTTVGTQLPDRWMLPDDVRDRTGVIFASAFPGYNDLADELTRFGIDNARREELAAVQAVRAKVAATDGDGAALAEIDRRIHDLQLALDHDGYTFDRRFLFAFLSMGHSVRRADRGTRAEHPGQRGVRQHHPSRRPGRGLDRAGRCLRAWSSPRRRHVRPPPRLDGRRLPRRAPPPRTRTSRTPPYRSTAGATG